MCYQPVHAVSFKKAITYVVKGKVTVIECYDVTLNRDWRMPAVVRLTHFVAKRVRSVKFSRRNVFLRDNGRCQYCGRQIKRSERTFDHVIPRSRGGEKSWENIVTSCRRCNTKKANRTPKEAGFTLIKKPVQPKWLPFYDVLQDMRHDVPEQWRMFLSV